MDQVIKSDEQWKAELTPEQFRVTRKHGTERAFTGEYWDHHADGLYLCVCCGAPLYDARDRFDSGTGWPSYSRPAHGTAVATQIDKSLFTTRTEVHCARCNAHLGHVFPDGPPPTGQRHCIN